MSDNGLVTSKVLAYMESLSPAARSLILRAMQNAGARGDEVLATEAVIAAIGNLPDAARVAPAPPVAAAPAAPVPAGAGWRERLEAAGLAPFAAITIDTVLPLKQTGRIARAAIEPIWTWIVRDVARREWEEALAADPGDPAADAGPVARRFRKAAVPLVLTRLRETEADPKGWQKLTVHLGGETVARELRDVIYVLQRDGQFLTLSAQLPKTIGLAEATDSAQLVAVVRTAVEQIQIDAAFVGAAILSRVAAPWLLGPLALRLAATQEARLLAGSRYARMIDIALSETERDVTLVRNRLADRRERMKVGGALRDFHDILRNLQFAFEIETVPHWFKRIGAARRDMSELIGKEIEAAPGLIRRALRVESLAGSFGGGFDVSTFEDAEFAVRLLGEARLASDNLALNDLIVRTRKQVEQTLEVLNGKLFADLKSNQAVDRAALIAAVDGAVKLNGLVFGEDYAAVLRKSREQGVAKAATRFG
jgi:hypothetical protein